ncbi:MAG: hypothetical protein ACRDRL_34185 [Sciscionella sp.]
MLFRLATSQRLERAVKAVPGGYVQAWRAASRYVAGRSRDEALIATADLLAQGLGVSVDLFGSLVRDRAMLDRHAELGFRTSHRRRRGAPRNPLASPGGDH